MPRGTPYTMKCPRCRRGCYGKLQASGEPVKTGRVDTRLYVSKHSGYGAGGPTWRGYRGEVRCFDCGHVWFSSHPRSGRVDVHPGGRHNRSA